MSDDPSTTGTAHQKVVFVSRDARRDRDDSRLTWLIDHFKREWQIYVMLAPAIIWFVLFLYKPMYGLQIAFKDYSIFRGIEGSPWVGWEHFQTLFGSDQFTRAVWNTIKISCYCTQH